MHVGLARNAVVVEFCFEEHFLFRHEFERRKQEAGYILASQSSEKVEHVPGFLCDILVQTESEDFE